jgi:hypothetical protein
MRGREGKEENELLKKCKDRNKLPKEKFVKYEGPEQLKKMIMNDKEKNGWKFKNE